MPERLSNIGYLALKKESSKGTAVTPDTYVPLYEESLSTNLNLDEDTPIMGNKLARYQVLPGQRDHQGEITVIAEPNTAARILDMILYKSGTTGSNPYTHAFTLDNSNNPNAYTVDIQRGQMVFRYMGLEASQLGIDFDADKMLFKITVSALKSFTVREVASVNSLILTLTTNYDPSPTTGLVNGDLIRIYKANGTVIDTTVTSVTATTVTVGSATGVAGGDYIALRPATPSYTVVTPFLWARTEFRFADTAANALSATHTPLEDGSAWTLKHMFKDNAGEKRSGSFDPVALVRTLGDVELSAKVYFDTPDEYNRFLSLTKRACVIRHFSTGTTYELRITLNNLKAIENNPPVKSGEIIYADIKYVPTYDTSDGQGFDVKVINAISSI